MRVSEYYGLDRNQSQLDFVDVDTVNDVAVYIDPSSIRRLNGKWGEECRLLLGNFFDTVLDAVKSGDRKRVSELLSNLSEPNETHLGVSKGKSKGRGLGKFLREEFAIRLSNSQAATSGLIEDLEDTALFISKVGRDIVSDITTNVIRGPLITYTRSMCDFYNIPTEQVHSGPVWNARTRDWEDGFVDLPAPDAAKLLLVPKVIVRRSLYLTKDDYYRSHLIPVLQDEEIDNPASALVQTAKSGRRYVTKQAIIDFYGESKEVVADLSLERPDVYRHYKETKRLTEPAPLTNEQLAESVGGPQPDWDELLSAVIGTPVGPDHATAYHHRVEALFTALFYPSLSMPVKESEIHEGRKRIDIRYTNTAQDGFFRWLIQQQVACKYLFVECKNYGREISNPEVDQISSRFSSLRGHVGILTGRSFADKSRVLARCRDTALDNRGYVLALDDEDLQQLVADVQESQRPPSEEELSTGYPITRAGRHHYQLLHDRFAALVS